MSKSFGARLQSRIWQRLHRGIKVMLALVCVSISGCDLFGYLDDTLYPQAGLPEYQMDAVIKLMHGVSVNTMGGNLLISRNDMAVDTVFGTWPISRLYSSADNRWHWNFDISYDGKTFVDESGAKYSNLDQLSNGHNISGSPWIKVDGDTLKTLGGRTYNFNSGSGLLETVQWGIDTRVRMHFKHESSDAACGLLGAGGYSLTLVQETDRNSDTDQVYKICRSSIGGQVNSVVNRASQQVTYEYNAWTGFLQQVRIDGKRLDHYAPLLDGALSTPSGFDKMNGLYIKTGDNEEVKVRFENLAGSQARRVSGVTMIDAVDGKDVEYEFQYSFDPGELVSELLSQYPEAGDKTSEDYKNAVGHVVNSVTRTNHTTTVILPNVATRVFTWNSDKELLSIKGAGINRSYEWEPAGDFRLQLKSRTETNGVRTHWNRFRNLDGSITVAEFKGGEHKHTTTYEPMTSNYYDSKNPFMHLVRKVRDSSGRILLSNTWSYGSQSNGDPYCPSESVGMRLISEDGAGDKTTVVYGLLAMGESDIFGSSTGMGLWGYTEKPYEIRVSKFIGWHGHPTETLHGPLNGYFRSCPMSSYNGKQYDEIGNVLNLSAVKPQDSTASEATPQSGGVLGWVYQEDRKLKTIQLSNQMCEDDTIDFVHRRDGQVLTVERPCGSKKSFVYDVFGRLVQEIVTEDSKLASTKTTYNNLNQVVLIEHPNGSSEQRSYKPHGKLKQKILKGATGSNAQTTVTYSYNLKMQLTGVATAVQTGTNIVNETEGYTYDSQGRIKTITYPDGATKTTYYDNRDRIEKEEYRGNKHFTVEYKYDLANRQVEMLYNGRSLIERDFKEGRVSGVRLGNGLVRQFKYETEVPNHPFYPFRVPRYLVNQMKTENAAGEVIEDTHPGGVEREWRGIPYWTEPSVMESSVVMAGGSRKQVRSSHKILDMQNMGRRVDTYVGEKFTFDALSNTSSTEYDATEDTAALGEDKSFTYSTDGTRLKSVTTGSKSIAYTYDASGRVVSRDGLALNYNGYGSITQWGTGSNTRLAVTYDGLNRPSQRVFVNASGDWELTYWCAGGNIKCDANGNWLTLDMTTVIVDVSGDEEHIFRHKDWRGNTFLLSNMDGEFITLYQYTGYGEPTVAGSNTDRDSRFTQAPQFDDLVILGPRLYDATANRFLSRDPAFNPINEYSYTLGNPVEFWDPSGLSAVPFETPGEEAVGKATYSYEKYWENFDKIIVNTGTKKIIDRLNFVQTTTEAAALFYMGDYSGSAYRFSKIHPASELWFLGTLAVLDTTTGHPSDNGFRLDMSSSYNWGGGHSTGRQVHDTLPHRRGDSYYGGYYD